MRTTYQWSSLTVVLAEHFSIQLTVDRNISEVETRRVTRSLEAWGNHLESWGLLL